MKIKSLLIIILTLNSLAQINAQDKAISKEPITIGETITLHSKVLDEDRTLNIYLPQSYAADSTKTYPVIYLLDGSTDEDFIHISGIVQFGSFSWINMIPETIVVGISNVDRKRDFTYPTTIERDKKDFPTTGESEKFIRFIETELQPFINSEYRVNNIKTIIGQSLGGLLAIEILFKNPDLFDNYIIVSPSLWWDNQSLLKLETEDYNNEKSVYIAVGKEGNIMEQDAKALYDKLESTKKDNTKVYFQFLEQQDHGDTLHLAVYGAFEALFKKED
ncbi:alpha/beta hydrolase-fold protein [Winogradskyella sp.]|jgi:predicted alpha/beta superfamily hydrolase|uniref:alpha/beta hydrolase n=1 Tax=Winogradskyella sp. TaxID=1883156 RepID=UPI0025FF4A00|nr:alpha/beta hydrolase-fold protein [Winogradskyella sp.]MCT4629095.1 alpha/beta hydrolase-fold protein [Winogradskyella sp.]